MSGHGHASPQSVVITYLRTRGVGGEEKKGKQNDQFDRNIKAYGTRPPCVALPARSFTPFPQQPTTNKATQKRWTNDDAGEFGRLNWISVLLLWNLTVLLRQSGGGVVVWQRGGQAGRWAAPSAVQLTTLPYQRKNGNQHNKNTPMMMPKVRAALCSARHPLAGLTEPPGKMTNKCGRSVFGGRHHKRLFTVHLGGGERRGVIQLKINCGTIFKCKTDKKHETSRTTRFRNKFCCEYFCKPHQLFPRSFWCNN